MASATFAIQDTPENRKELMLLLMTDHITLDHASHNGVITVEFPDLLEDKALHVLSSAVSNHGFKHTLSGPASKVTTTIAVDSKTIARAETSGKPRSK